MITNLAQTALLVREYDEAKAFYCGKLGFTVVEDTLLPSGKRWVRLKVSGGQGTELLLSKAEGDQREIIGHQAAGRVLFFLHTNDLEGDFKSLTALGVEFTERPRTESYGKVAVFKDL